MISREGMNERQRRAMFANIKRTSYDPNYWFKKTGGRMGNIGTVGDEARARIEEVGDEFLTARKHESFSLHSPRRDVISNSPIKKEYADLLTEGNKFAKDVESRSPIKKETKREIIKADRILTGQEKPSHYLKQLGTAGLATPEK